MKTNTKITLLFVALLGFFVLFALGYFYIRAEEQRLYVESKQSSDTQVIRTVLEFKMEGFLKPVKDNSAWDEMVAFSKTKDTNWAKNNLNPILSTFNMSYLGTFDLNGEPIFSVHDSTGKVFSLSLQKLKELFSEKSSFNSFIFQNGQLCEIFGATIVPTFDIAHQTNPNGYLVAAKIWNSEYRAEIEKATGFKLAIQQNGFTNSDQQNQETEVIYHELDRSNSQHPGFILFQRANHLAGELNTLGYFAIAGSLILILVCLVFFYWINRWISIPLNQITKSLSNGNIGSVKDILEKQNEFGEIARLIRKFHTQQIALTEAKEFAELIYKVIPSALFTVDCDQKITSWNKQAEEITGFSKLEMIGNTCHTFADSPCSERCGLLEPTIIKPIHGRECTIRSRSGQTIIISKNVDTLKDEKGNIIGGIESFEDITERKQIEISLKKAKEEAERASKAKSEFLATMSHEIRTPMNGVIGMTELALTTQLTGSQRDYLETIQTSAYLLLDTINDILDFSKIEAGKLEIEHIRFNIYDVLEKSVDILTVKAFEKNLELLCEIEPGLPEFFFGDPLRIRQILVNFISNAIKFTEKGEIFISARKQPGTSAIDGELRIVFSVKDTGIGIEDSAQLNIFNQFTQADNSTTRKYGGTGLGLSISKMLTEIMHGSLFVESELGVGSNFSFELPLKISPDDPNAEEVPKPTIKKVLVVDDNHTNLKIMKDMLTYWGIDSTICNNGKEALAVLQTAIDSKNVFDLVILDMCMPDMDGIAVAEKIRSNQNLNRKPVIFMYSSIEKNNVIEKSKGLGIDKYLTKPVKMKDFFDLLHHEKSQSQDKPRQLSLASDDTISVEPGKTILIAEDNSINLKLLSVMLSKTGVRVISATNGDEAIVQFRNNNIDLIFMDVHMPERDGLQATKDIRKMESPEKRIPIIALTAIAMPGDREKCIEAGMDDYLSKPFRKDDLYAVIKKYLIAEKPEIA